MTRSLLFVAFAVALVLPVAADTLRDAGFGDGSLIDSNGDFFYPQPDGTYLDTYGNFFVPGESDTIDTGGDAVGETGSRGRFDDRYGPADGTADGLDWSAARHGPQEPARLETDSLFRREPGMYMDVGPGYLELNTNDDP